MHQIESVLERPDVARLAVESAAAKRSSEMPTNIGNLWRSGRAEALGPSDIRSSTAVAEDILHRFGQPAARASSLDGAGDGGYEQR